VVNVRRPAHYFDARPAVDSEPRAVDLVLPDVTLRLATDRGVFAARAIDPGTKLLLMTAPVDRTARTLADVGCGYGPIAMALAHRAPDAVVWAIDINERARALCRANAAALGIGARVQVATPDDVPPDVVFDAIYSNPPIRIGKPALHALLRRWLLRLKPEGRAYLVVQKHLGADSLARWLTDEGFTVDRLVSRQSYRVFEIGSAV
jgi:16S rRNA (guanine1207-N2)-methyltransferase